MKTKNPELRQRLLDTILKEYDPEKNDFSFSAERESTYSEPIEEAMCNLMEAEGRDVYTHHVHAIMFELMLMTDEIGTEEDAQKIASFAGECLRSCLRIDFVYARHTIIGRCEKAAIK